MRVVVQALLGAVLGFVFSWLGLQVIPAQSGALTAVLTLAAAVAVALVVFTAWPRLRTAAAAFGVAAALLTGVLFVVVIG